MKFTYSPRGVCARNFAFDVEDGVLRSIEISGGCHGNLQGIASLLKDMPVNEIIARLKGIRCGMKPTSCPDQIAQALTLYLEQNG